MTADVPEETLDQTAQRLLGKPFNRLSTAELQELVAERARMKRDRAIG